MSQPEEPPERGELLYSGLFGSKEALDIFQKISTGLVACSDNARRLLTDAAALRDSDRFASALFLTSTAREEIAKVYILLDLCRLSFVKHESVLHRLCKQFYNHIVKHGYYETIEAGATSMAHAKEWWVTSTLKWYPGAGPESGEPDFFPHDTVYLREFPLYVDLDSDAGRWSEPNDERYTSYFSGIGNVLDEVNKALKSVTESQLAGFFRPEFLTVLNRVFSASYVSDATPNEEIARLHAKLYKELLASGQNAEAFIGSAVSRWPLYHFAAQARL